jgi:hypothetical protein
MVPAFRRVHHAGAHFFSALTATLSRPQRNLMVIDDVAHTATSPVVTPGVGRRGLFHHEEGSRRKPAGGCGLLIVAALVLECAPKSCAVINGKDAFAL